MKNVYIIHRWDGTPEADWYPWLKDELEKLGIEVHVPVMPNPEKPDMNEWVSCLSEQLGEPDKNTYLVGHSIGCRTILLYLEKNNVKIGGAVLVAGWVALKNLETEEEKEVAKPWIETPLNSEKIKEACPRIVGVFSDNDPNVDLEQNSKVYKEQLGAEIVVEHNKGHFTESDGVTELPAVLEELKKIMNI